MGNQHLQNLVQSLQGPIVVFGASGFVGANLAQFLGQYRKDVFAVTHQLYIPWRLINFPQEQIIHCDITERDAVIQLFEMHRFQTVFCLSAYGAYSHQKESHLIYQTNFLGLLNILESSKRTDVKAIVHAGSSSEYGLNCESPTENATLVPNSHYSVSKVASSFLVEYFAKFHDCPVTNLRLYSIYGPFEDPDRLIPKLVLKGLEGQFPPLVSPEISRDFVYIDDCVEAFILAALKIDSVSGQSINIASETKTTIANVVDMIRDLFNITASPVWGNMPNRNWDLVNWYGNAGRAHDSLGWRAKTPLRSGLQLTANWFQHNFNEFYGERVLKAIKDPLRLSFAICVSEQSSIDIHKVKDLLKQISTDLKIDYELLIVIDSKESVTEKEILHLSHENPRVHVFKHSRNFGPTASFFSALEHATGDAFILLSHELLESENTLKTVIHRWLDGFDVVEIVFPSSKIGYLEKTALAFYNRLSDAPLLPGHSESFLLSKKVYQMLRTLTEKDPFIPGLRSWFGHNTTFVTLSDNVPKHGKSLFQSIAWWKHAFFDYSKVPGEFFFYSGVLITLLSLLLGIAQVIAKLLDPSIPHGVTTILLVVLFFGGINMLGISFLVDFLAKTSIQVKNRPRSLFDSPPRNIYQKENTP